MFSGQNWSKLVQTGQNWSKLVQTCQNCSKLVQTGQNWPKIHQNWSSPVSFSECSTTFVAFRFKLVRSIQTVSSNLALPPFSSVMTLNQAHSKRKRLKERHLCADNKIRSLIFYVCLKFIAFKSLYLLRIVHILTVFRIYGG